MIRRFSAILCIYLLFCDAMAFATAYTASVSGPSNSAATFGGSGVPTTGDTVAVNAGVTVTQSGPLSLGSNASAVGIGLYIKGAVGNEGKWDMNGQQLTLAGTDRSANAALKTDAYGKLEHSGGALVLNQASDMQTAILMNGRHWDSVGGGSISSTGTTWNNATGTVTVPSTAVVRWDIANNVNMVKLTGPANGAFDPGQVSNAAGTGPGSFGDSSLSFTSSQITGVEKRSRTELATANAGDYAVDYLLGRLYFKNSGGNVSGSYSYMYRKGFAFTVLATNQAAGSNINIGGAGPFTFTDCGSTDPTWSIASDGGCYFAAGKAAPTLNADRELIFNNVTCAYCTHVLQITSANTDATHRIQIQNLTVTRATYPSIMPAGGGSQTPVETSGTGAHGSYNTTRANGILDIQANYVDVINPTINSIIPLNVSANGNLDIDVEIKGLTGTVAASRLLPAGTSSTSSSVAGLLQNVTIEDVAGILDSAGISQGGDAAHGNNVYDNIVINHAHRCARVTQYMTFQNIVHCYNDDHHGLVLQSQVTNAYLDGSTSIFSGAILDKQNDPLNLGGCHTFSYNISAWLRNWTYKHFTCDQGLRGVDMNDQETTLVLCTRCKAIDGIVANSTHGVYQAANGATTNIVSFGGWIDYLRLFNNTTSNVTPATFKRGGSEYCFGTNNIAGVCLWNPQGYTLPDLTSRSLVATVVGTAGTNYSHKLAWAGGTQVETVVAQGTCNGTGNTTTVCGVSGTPYTSSSMLTYQVWISGGTNAGQFGMIRANATNSFTVIAENANTVMPSPFDSTTTFVIFKSQNTLTDSGGSNTVQATIDTPTLTTAVGTYTDAGITIEQHTTFTDPKFLNAYGENFIPSDLSLCTAASDGTTVGALPCGIFPSSIFVNPVKF